jgi:UDP-glucuronate 4-epimerase
VFSHTSPRVLVTGAYGCIGAWVVRGLVEREIPVVTFDLGDNDYRLAQTMSPDAAARVPRVHGDITDLAHLEQTLDEHAITNVIHLAALQVPFCRADPPLGARVNVLGTVNVFEAVRRRLDRMAPIVYASSVAAFDAPEDGVSPAMSAYPGTIYGVYKRANEGTAWVYSQESGVASVGLRPHTVYGVGRDQGLTSAPTAAMLAAAAGVPFTIPYGGASQLQLAADVARAFIGASLSGATGATIHNVPGRKVSIAEVIEAISTAVPGSATAFEDVLLPFPEEVDAESFAGVVPGFAETPLDEGVGATIERFRQLLSDGRIAAPTTT